MLKKCDVDAIMKSQQQILGEVFDGKEKAKSRERNREAARIAIASIKRTVDFGDGFQAERELLAIMGSPRQILDKAFDGKETMKKVDMWEKKLQYLQEEKAKSQRKKDREAAWIAIASVKRTVDFDDDFQAEKEFLAIIGAPQPILGKPFDEKGKMKKVERWEKQLQLQESQREKDREATRISIASMKEFEDGFQAEGDLLAIMRPPSHWDVVRGTETKIEASSDILCRSQSRVQMPLLNENIEDNKILRTAMLKKHDVDAIIKSQQQILDEAFDGEMKIKEKAKSLERDREAARIAIASIKRTVDFGDGIQAERELLAIMGAPKHILDKAFDGKEKKVDMWEKKLQYLQEEKAKWQRKKDREAARIAIASVKRTVDFDDDFQAEKDFLAIIGAPQPILGKPFDEKGKTKKVEWWEKQLQLQESQREKDREAARILSIASMKEFEDGFQAEGDMMAIMRAPSRW